MIGIFIYLCVYHIMERKKKTEKKANVRLNKKKIIVTCISFIIIIIFIIW